MAQSDVRANITIEFAGQKTNGGNPIDPKITRESAYRIIRSISSFLDRLAQWRRESLARAHTRIVRTV